MSENFRTRIVFDKLDEREVSVMEFSAFRSAMVARMNGLTEKLNKLVGDLQRLNVGDTVTTIVNRSSSGGSSGGGSSSVGTLASSYAVSAGSNTVPIPADMQTGTVDYIVFAILVATNTDFGAQILGQPETKATASFTYGDIPVAGTIYFNVKAKA